MPMTPEALYLQLGQLIREMPNFTTGRLDDAQMRWLGRAAALVSETGDLANIGYLRNISDFLGTPTGTNPQLSAHEIRKILYRALAWAEARAPAETQGAFIPAGNVFDAIAAAGKVIQSASQTLLIVDPYIDQNALTEFAVMAAERTTIRILTDAQGMKPGFPPALARWCQQYGETRPAEARKTAPRALHDRLMIVDGAQAYMLGQSLNAFATRAPTAIVRADPETAQMKIRAYAEIWESATPL